MWITVYFLVSGAKLKIALVSDVIGSFNLTKMYIAYSTLLEYVENFNIKSTH